MRILSLLAAIVLGSLAVSPAKAVTSYELVATSNAPLVLSGWSLTFNDTDPNGLFDDAELTSFTGFEEDDGSNLVFYDGILLVAGITDISVGLSLDWGFSSSSFGISNIFGAGRWSYQLSPVSQIPLPAPLLLLVTALAGLFGVSRLQRKAVAA